MSRDEFFAKVASLYEERLREALWNLYWRGTAAMRERIEAELTPDTGLPRRKAPEPADPARVREEAEDFVALARSGAYIAGKARPYYRRSRGKLPRRQPRCSATRPNLPPATCPRHWPDMTPALPGGRGCVELDR